MTKYREILRLSALGLSQQDIASSCSVSKKKVNRVLKKAKEINLSWPLDENQTDAVLAERLFPSADKPVASTKRMPDFAYIRKGFKDQQINETYQEMAEHYGTAIIPARICKSIQ